MMTLRATWCCISTILAVCVHSSLVSASCPTWFYYNDTTDQCECGGLVNFGQIKCKYREQKMMLGYGYCINTTEGGYYLGQCPYRYTQNSTNRLYSELPSDPDLLNEVLCGPYNRKGFLCEECIERYGPAV